MGRGCRACPSSRAGRPGAARPSQPVDAGASTLRPFLPHAPSFPGPTGGPPLRSGSERRSPAWRPPAATAPALRTAQQGAAMWGRQGLCCPHCVRDDYGDQRERSGIARVAVPRRAEPEDLAGFSAAHLGAGPSFASVRFGGQASCPRRGRRRGSTSSTDARRGLTGGLLRSFSRSAASAVRGSSLLPTRELKSSLYFRAGRSLPPTQTDSAPRLPDTPQTTRQPASILATVRASVSFGGQASCPRRSPTPDTRHRQSAQARPLKKKTRDKRAKQSD